MIQFRVREKPETAHHKIYAFYQKSIREICEINRPTAECLLFFRGSDYEHSNEILFA
jgi:hypothetical protein